MRCSSSSCSNNTSSDSHSNNSLLQLLPPTQQQQRRRRGGGGCGSNMITYRERLGGHLHPRDLRRLVMLSNPFFITTTTATSSSTTTIAKIKPNHHPQKSYHSSNSTTSDPEIWIRRHVILMNFSPLRAIILRDRMLLLLLHPQQQQYSPLENNFSQTKDNDDDNVNIYDRIISKLELQLHGSDSSGSSSFPSSPVDPSSLSPSPSSSSLLQPIPQQSSSMQDGRSNSNYNSQQLPTHVAIHHDWVSSTSDDMMLRVGEDDDHHLMMTTTTTTTTMTMTNQQHHHQQQQQHHHMDQDEMEELQCQTWIHLPFELQCVDSVLHVAIEMLSNQTMALANTCEVVLHQLLPNNSRLQQQQQQQFLFPLLQRRFGNLTQERLRIWKNHIQNIEYQIQAFVRAITLLLNEEEDLALMNLSRLITHPERFQQPVPVTILEEESDEPELILEAHRQQAMSLIHMVQSIEHRFQITTNVKHIQSDTMQNTILYVTLLLDLSSLAITLVTSIVGKFGMNMSLPGQMAENPISFGVVVLMSTTSATIVFFVVMSLLRQSGILTGAIASISTVG